MIEKVSTIGVFNTTMGCILLVDNDRLFQVGQIIESNKTKYRILGIQPNHDIERHRIGLRVERIN